MYAAPPACADYGVKPIELPPPDQYVNGPISVTCWEMHQGDCWVSPREQQCVGNIGGYIGRKNCCSY